MEFSKIKAEDLHKDVQYDGESGLYVLPTYNLAIEEDDLLDTFYYHGKLVLEVSHQNRRMLPLGKELIDLRTLQCVLFSDNDPVLMSYTLGELEVFETYNPTPIFLPELLSLKHIAVDMVNIYNGERYSKVSRPFAQRKLECRASLIWDLIHPNAAGKIGKDGWYLRSHYPNDFIINSSYHPYADVADQHGIYLLVKLGDDVVRIFDNLEDICKFIIESSDIKGGITVDSLASYLRDNRETNSYHGWKIRRVDDIDGQSVRFGSIGV